MQMNLDFKEITEKDMLLLKRKELYHELRKTIKDLHYKKIALIESYMKEIKIIDNELKNAKFKETNENT